MNFLQTITGTIGLETTSMSSNNINSENWLFISAFLFFLLGILVITTSLKSKRIKKLEKKIKQLKRKIEKK